ncbi:MAG: GNAT family N-acetyltransferase [Chitinophagales bacterium]
MIFDFETEYELENDAVLLRPLKLSDLDNLISFAITEPELWKYSIDAIAGEKNFKIYIEKAIDGRVQQKDYPFIVFDKRKGKYAGSTRFYDIQINNAALKIGYTWYGKDFQGTGLNKNCKYLLLEFAFEKMKMNRVAFEANNNNQKSIAAMKSIGCTVEGVLREVVLNYDGTKRDNIILSILKKEWDDSVKDNLRTRL